MDGPVIQHAAEQALRARRARPATCCSVVEAARRRGRPRGRHDATGTRCCATASTPSPATSPSAGRARRDHARPHPRRGRELARRRRPRGLDPIFLVAPSSTDERIAATAARQPRLPLRRLDDGRHRRPRRGRRRRATALVEPGARAHRPARRASGWACAPARRPPRSRRSPTASSSARRWSRRAEHGRAAVAPADHRARRRGAGPARARLSAVSVLHVRATVLAYLPSPPQGVWHLGPIPLRAYALCIIAGDRRRGRRRTSAGWSPAAATPGTVTDVAVFAVPFGLVGGAALPRDHRLADVLRARRRPGRRAVRLAGRARDLGRASRSAASAPGSAAAGAASPLTAFADAVAPGIVARPGDRPARQLVQPGALRRARPRCRGGSRSDRRVDPATGVTDNLDGVAVDRRRRDRAPDLPLRAAVEPRGRRAGRRGPTAASASARPGVRALRRGLHAPAASASS